MHWGEWVVVDSAVSTYPLTSASKFFVFRHFQLSGGEILSSEVEIKDGSSRTVGRSNSVTLGCLTLSEVKMQLAFVHEVFFFFNFVERLSSVHASAPICLLISDSIPHRSPSGESATIMTCIDPSFSPL